MKKIRKNIIKAVSVVGIVIILGIVWIIYDNLKTKTYIFPENFVDYSGITIEQQIEDITKVNLNEDVCTMVYAKKDGSLALKLNKSQWNWWINNTKEKIEKSQERIKEKGGELTVSDDRKSVIFEIPEEIRGEDLIIESGKVTLFAAEYQILIGENSEDWEIYLCFKNIETGEIIADGTIPYDTIEFTDEDLK